LAAQTPATTAKTKPTTPMTKVPSKSEVYEFIIILLIMGKHGSGLIDDHKVRNPME